MCVGEFFSLVNLIEINISSQANVNGASGYGAQARFFKLIAPPFEGCAHFTASGDSFKVPEGQNQKIFTF